MACAAVKLVIYEPLYKAHRYWDNLPKTLPEEERTGYPLDDFDAQHPAQLYPKYHDQFVNNGWQYRESRLPTENRPWDEHVYDMPQTKQFMVMAPPIPIDKKMTGPGWGMRRKWGTNRRPDIKQFDSNGEMIWYEPTANGTKNLERIKTYGNKPLRNNLTTGIKRYREPEPAPQPLQNTYDTVQSRSPHGQVKSRNNPAVNLLPGYKGSDKLRRWNQAAQQRGFYTTQDPPLNVHPVVKQRFKLNSTKQTPTVKPLSQGTTVSFTDRAGQTVKAIII